MYIYAQHSHTHQPHTYTHARSTHKPIYIHTHTLNTETHTTDNSGQQRRDMRTPRHTQYTNLHAHTYAQNTPPYNRQLRAATERHSRPRTHPAPNPCPGLRNPCPRQTNPCARLCIRSRYPGSVRSPLRLHLRRLSLLLGIDMYCVYLLRICVHTVCTHVCMCVCTHV